MPTLIQDMQLIGKPLTFDLPAAASAPFEIDPNDAANSASADIIRITPQADVHWGWFANAAEALTEFDAIADATHPPFLYGFRFQGSWDVETRKKKKEGNKFYIRAAAGAAVTKGLTVERYKAP